MYNLEFRNKVSARHGERKIITCASCQRQTEVPSQRMLCDECNDEANELQRSYRIGGVYADTPVFSKQCSVAAMGSN